MKVDKSIDVPLENKTATLALAYFQNLDLPHLGDEQPQVRYNFLLSRPYCPYILVNITKDQLYPLVLQN